MLTTDLSLRFDPAYEKISRRFLEDPQAFADAFARAWFKLTHRDMGPRARYLGPEVPKEELIWQDPIPKVDHALVDAADIAALKAKILAIGAVGVRAGVDGLGFGFHLPRWRQARRRQWRAHPPGAAEGLGSEPARAAGESAESARRHPGGVQRHGQRGGKKVSLADLIVLARQRGGREGGAGCRRAGDGAVLRRGARMPRRSRPMWNRSQYAGAGGRWLPQLRSRRSSASPAEHLLVDRAQLLTLTAPEMTVLVGGLRVLGANTGGAKHGVFTTQPGTLSNDFFVNLLDMGTEWKATSEATDVYEGRDRKTGAVKWTATRVTWCSVRTRVLRALAEVYASADGEAEVRAGLRGRVDEGDEPGSLRPGVIAG